MTKRKTRPAITRGSMDVRVKPEHDIEKKPEGDCKENKPEHDIKKSKLNMT